MNAQSTTQPTSTHGATLTGRPPEWNELANRLSGDLLLPADPDWDRARQAWNLVVDQQPLAVALPAERDDVVQIMRHASATEHRVAFQATGHGATTLEQLDDVVLVRTDRLQDIEVDPPTKVARVGAGVLARDLVEAGAAHGLTFLAGSSPDVGVVGYTLGGGLGWLGRRYGLACNTVVAAEIVTAQGEARRIDADHDPELFWAIRGGGGSFAAITALHLELFAVPQLYAGTMLWPMEQAAQVLETWRVWTHDLPDDVTSIARLLRYPPIPDLPDHLRGRRFVAVEAAFLDGERESDMWLRPLRVLKPEIETFATSPAAELGKLHGDPTQPVPALSDHRLLSDLPAAALGTILEVAGPDADCPLLAVDIRHLGGALGRSAPGHGVLDRIAADYALFGVGLPMTSDAANAIGSCFEELRTGLVAWDAGTQYLNFADRPVDPSRLFGPDRYDRIRAVKASYDPSQRFVSNHPIPLPG